MPFDFLYNRCLKHFSFQGELSELAYKCILFFVLVYIVLKLKISRQIVRKICKLKITRKYLLWGGDLSHADRRTDRYDETYSRFTQFCETCLEKGHINQSILVCWPVYEQWVSTYIVGNDLSVYLHSHTDVGAPPTAYRGSGLGINVQKFQPGFLSHCSAKIVNALSCGGTVSPSSRSRN